jgi:FAD dependent oxidoreductase TIGR03364
MARCVIVGGGVLGTMHAHQALQRGWSVTHLERDVEPRSATVRNFGMVWISGRAPGDELRFGLRARQIWAELGAEVPGIGFSPEGSLLTVWDQSEIDVVDEVLARDDAILRELQLLDPAAARELNPALRGDFAAALWCPLDAKVEPRHCLPAIRQHLTVGWGAAYHWLAPRTITAIGNGTVTDHTGAHHEADLVIVCPGAEQNGPIAELLEHRPLRRVKLQMLQTAPLDQPLTTMLADSTSLRFYPGFDVPARAALPPAPDVVERNAMQLLCSQRATGELTVGDTHATEPFPVDLDAEPEAYLLERLGAMLGRPAPPVLRRWSGVYSQRSDQGVTGAPIWHTEAIHDRTLLVTGPGGRGMTLAPAIAEHTFDRDLPSRGALP